MSRSRSSPELKLERERRKTAREEHLWEVLKSPGVLGPLVGVGGALVIQKLGHERVIDRDFGGFLMAAWVAYTASAAGIKDKYALFGLSTAATAAYALATPPKDDEVFAEVVPSKLLGGDGKLFGISIPIITEAFPAL